jgi:hypothetical protein
VPNPEVFMDVVPQLSAVAIDCADPLSLGLFWQRLLGGDLRPRNDGDTELHEATVRLDFCRVPDPPSIRKNRVPLDLKVPAESRQEAIDRALELGATRADDIYAGDLWACLRDPEGNEFCIVWGAA